MTYEWRYPPRPENETTLLNYYENKGWVAQIKRNGTCSLAFVDEAAQVTFKTRKNEDHKAWVPTDEARAFFAQWPESDFVFELLHSKGGGVKDTIYLFDILRWHGRNLTGTTLAWRLTLLSHLFIESKVHSDRLTLVKTYWPTSIEDPPYQDIFEALSDPLDEGLVLKDPKALLEDCRQKNANQGWQVKCRRTTKNFGF